MPAFIQAPGQVVRWMTVDTFTRVPGWNKLRVHMVFNDDRIPGWSRNGKVPLFLTGYILQAPLMSMDVHSVQFAAEDAFGGSTYRMDVHATWACIEIVPVVVNKDTHFPDKCPKCQGPAYFGAVPAAFECKRGCRR